MAMTSSEQQQFCLRWNNFQSNIISAFEYLRVEEDFVDVTLACEGRSLKAHKVILSACSQYFRQLLKTTPCQHPIIVLKDVCYEDLLSLMCFVYQGVVYIGQDRLTQFLKTAEFLQIKGLSEQTVGEAFGESTPTSCMRPPSSQNSTGNIPALTPISDGRPGESAVSPPFSSAHSSPSPSPVLRADGSSGGCTPSIQPPSSTSRRKPVHPIHAFVPADESGDPQNCSEVKVEPTSICENGPTAISDNGNGGNGSNGGSECQDVALSLVSETSILRQRIEGSSPLDGSQATDNNGIASPVPLLSIDRSKLPSKLLMDPGAISMVGRENMGFPFLPQPGTSSLMTNHVSTSNVSEEQINSPNSPRYRQRWRCMQPSICPHCMRTFSNAFNLKQHIINVHTFGNELKCEVCGKVQKNKWYLRKHMVKSHNAPLRRVKLPDGTMVNTE